MHKQEPLQPFAVIFKYPLQSWMDLSNRVTEVKQEIKVYRHQQRKWKKPHTKKRHLCVKRQHGEQNFHNVTYRSRVLNAANTVQPI